MHQPIHRSASEGNVRLEGWKEIALYLKRDVTTVQRWEKQAALPVRRHRHGRRDIPYAYAADLDRWFERTASNNEAGPETATSAGPDDADIGVSTKPRFRDGRLIPAVLIAALGLAVATAGVRRSPSPRPPQVRLDLLSPSPDLRMRYPVISADGRELAFVGQPLAGPTTLWIRALSRAVWRQVPNSADAMLPFWSPDGRSIGYFANRQLRVVDLDNMTTRVLADAPAGRGATWNRQGVILFAPSDVGGLYQVLASGSTPQRATEPVAGERSHRHPHFLADDEHFVFSVWGQSERAFALKIGSLGGGTQAPLATSITSITQSYAPPGYLLFGSAGSLVAKRFDLSRLRSTGEARTLADHLSFDDFGQWAFSVSNNAVLVYETAQARPNELVWVDRTGQRLKRLASGAFSDIALSHDNRFVAAAADDDATLTTDIWMIDAESGSMVRLTHDPEAADSPLWSLDDKYIVFSSARNTTRGDLYIRPAKVEGVDKVLLASTRGKAPQDWTPEGRLLFAEGASGDLFIMPGNNGQPERVLAPNSRAESQSGHQPQSRLSPDGRLVAYASNMTGRWQVYVGSYPPTGQPVQVSDITGDDPRWSSDSEELYYRADRALMAVRVTRGTRVHVSRPSELFAVAADRLVDFVPGPGNRFLLNVPSGPPPIPSLSVILNWDGPSQ